MKKLTTEDFIFKAKLIHGDKYDYSLVDYNGKRFNVEIKCLKHGEFIQNSGVHLSGGGCKKCNSDKMTKNNTCTTLEFIKKANKIHGSKYDYSFVNYKKSSIKIKINCLLHEQFLQTPANHLSGHGCSKCGDTINGDRSRMKIREFIKKSNEIHANKYNYSLVEYKNSSTKVKIICREHGIFKQTPNSHISSKSGCICCSGKNKITLESFIKRANKIHGNKYDYSHVNEIKNNSIKIKIICDKHKEFTQSPDAHLNKKQGCPNCNESKGENIISNLLSEKNIIFNRQKTFKNCINDKTGRFLKFDFYLPNNNLCIEFDGEQHFRPIKRFGGEKGYNSTIYRDNIKNKFCVDNNIDIIRIKYNETIIEKLKNI